MKRKQFQHPLLDGRMAFVHRWLPEIEVRGVVQVVHGMAEHGARYEELAHTLTGAGFAVYAQDLPGHGRSVRAPDELGHVADHGSWAVMLSAINGVRELIQHQLHDPQIFMLGHSMGSFLLQSYIAGHGHNLAGAVFSATTGDLGPMRAIGSGLLRLEALWHGRRHRSALAELMSFKDFNRHFRPNRTASDWLSRDAAEVDLYVADRLCGFRCSCALWIDLLEAGASLVAPERLRLIPPKLPVLLIAGSADPVCRGAEGPNGLAGHYRQTGVQQVDVRIYEGARHELLHETCREQVTGELLDWLLRHS